MWKCYQIATLCGRKAYFEKGTQSHFPNHFPSYGKLFYLYWHSLDFFFFFFLNGKGNGPYIDQTNDVDIKEVFSISTFDGRAMYKEIIKATEDFDAKFFLEKVGFGVVYKAKLTSRNIVAVKKLLPLCDGEIQ